MKPDSNIHWPQGSILLLDSISGSHAYGLATEQSDIDYKGVFAVSKDAFYSLGYPQQVSDERNDKVYYELGRFLELLAKNNPNMLELLAVPQDCLQFQHPLLAELDAKLFLSKLCHNSFAGYAKTQMKKAKGLKKKVMNPMAKERKEITDFCYVNHKGWVQPLKDFLEKNMLEEANCGLAKLSHFRESYNLYYGAGMGFKGIRSSKEANDVCLSSIPKGIKPIAMLSFNQGGYSTYCKEYKMYWEWVELRNQARYEAIMEHSQGYDAKNMMHTFRLLFMALEIAEQGHINVRRKDREQLLAIRQAKYSYHELSDWAEELLHKIEYAYSRSDLPAQPDFKRINQLAIDLRMSLYGS